jgi:geranylgeranylglycerol-phosphate geranylgeranyltransferase
MMGLAVVVGAALASINSLAEVWINLIYGFVTGFTLTAASMAVNDYYDREIDKINEPNRPIPSGSISPKEALGFASVLTAVGLISAYLTNPGHPLCLAGAVVALAIFIVYTTVGKRSGLPGNFLVSVCVSIPFVYGSIVITNEVRLNVLLFASMAFLSNTGREITKGIVDLEGDTSQNVRTLAVRYGKKSAAVGASAFYLSSVLLSSTPWFLGLMSLWFIPFVIVTDAGLIASSLTLLKNQSRENARRTKNTVLLWFTIGLLAFIAGTVK